MVNNRFKLAGVFPVLQVPYQADWRIDWDDFDCQIDWILKHGARGCVLAMVSEIIRLTDNERKELVGRTVEAVSGRVPVIVSVGDECTVQAIAHLHAAADCGADIVMATPPALTKCSQDEIFTYYKALLEAREVSLIIQDASGYLGQSVSLEVQVKLYERYGSRVMFKPEAPPIGQHITALMEATKGNAVIFDGLGGLMLIDHYHRGASGVMPAADVVWATTALWHALSENDMSAAIKIHTPIAAMANLMCNLDAFLAIIKMLLVEQGVFKSSRVRGPVGFSLDQLTRDAVLRHFKQMRESVDSVGQRLVE